MFKRITLIGISITFFGNIALYANGNLARIATEQEKLAQNILNIYKSKDKKKLLITIRKLENGHAKLSSHIRNRELKNLLVYLDLCINDLEKLSKNPYSRRNADRVAELSDSLREGNHYILSSL